jgi:ABC-2 type transport system ATP-binding protein
VALADRLELDLSRRVAFMSTGMRQKLALAATLSANTLLLILDEPTANLDPTVRTIVLELVAQACRDGRTVIFSSHVLSEVEEACDRVAILRAGKVAVMQPMAELRRRHRIRIQLVDRLPPPPAEIARDVAIHRNGEGYVTIDTAGELSPLLGWLATVPLREVSVEPTGLKPLYEQVHPKRSSP